MRGTFRIKTDRPELGQGVVEYALLLALVVLGAIGGIVVFAQSTQSLWGRILNGVAPAI